jgi:hypothetical protein
VFQHAQLNWLIVGYKTSQGQIFLSFSVVAVIDLLLLFSLALQFKRFFFDLFQTASLWSLTDDCTGSISRLDYFLLSKGDGGNETLNLMSQFVLLDKSFLRLLLERLQKILVKLGGLLFTANHKLELIAFFFGLRKYELFEVLGVTPKHFVNA